MTRCYVSADEKRMNENIFTRREKNESEVALDLVYDCVCECS